MKSARELRAQRAQILDQARALVDTAETADRNLTQDEQTQYDNLRTQADELLQRAERLEAMPAQLPQAPAVIGRRGDSEIQALAAFVRSGDRGAVRSMLATEADERGREVENLRIHVPTALEMRFEQRATDEVFTSGAAEAGPSIPTGFSGQIAARRSEIRLAERLGVRNVPGRGLTVNFPYENADPTVFATTAEQVDAHGNTYERDRPTLATKAFTLVKKTKKIELPEEVIADEDANLMGFIADHIGRAVGMTHNAMLITEAAASGTKALDFTSKVVMTAGEAESLVFSDTLSYYLDDSATPAWVMRPTTLALWKKLTGDSRLYAEQSMGSNGFKTLLEYPVFYSNQAAAIGALAKSTYFGNWYWMGMREDPGLNLLRDPYTYDGLVLLKYSFRAVYGVLAAGAIAYGAHPA